MLFNYRVIKLIQRLAKLFSTQTKRNYKVSDLALSVGIDRKEPSVLLKQNQLMAILGLRTYNINGPGTFKKNAHESPFSKQTIPIADIASRNYKINSLRASMRNSDKKSLFMKDRQFIAELGSRKIAALSATKRRSRKEHLLRGQKPVRTESASRNYKAIILTTLRSNEKNKFILTKHNHLYIELPCRSIKVAVVGAAGGVGQPLSLLLKLNPYISELALYDVVKITPGVAVDLSHINTCARVRGYVGDKQICGCLRESKVVVIPAGVAMVENFSSRDDLFKANAPIVYRIMEAVAKNCPSAMIALVTNPVDSLVPLAYEVMKKFKVCADSRLFGVNTLDLVRASTFVAQFTCENPSRQYVPVVGGHGGVTIVPLLSQSVPPACLDDYTRMGLSRRIQDACFEVVEGKQKKHTATLSTAYAVARFINSLLKGLTGQKNIVETAYVKADMKECSYFAAPLVLGPGGIEAFLGPKDLDTFEKSVLDQAVCVLKQSIKAGEDFAACQK